MTDEQAKTVKTDVLIVGGGLAGLTCAVGLRGSGLKVTVIEQDSRLGGRAQSWTEPTTGDPVHIGPHILLNPYPNMFRLLDRLGTSHKVIFQPAGEFIFLVDGAKELPIRAAPLPSPFHQMPSAYVDRELSTWDRLSTIPITAFALQATEDEILSFDDRRAIDVLREFGVSEAFIERFWQFTALAILNVPLEQCSAAALLRFHKHLTGHRSLGIGFSDGGLGDLFAPAAKAAIERDGGEVWLSCPARAFRGTPGRVTGVTLADGRAIEARLTVGAVPPQALHALLPAEWRARLPEFEALSQLEPCPYISPYLWFDRKLTRRPFWARYRSPRSINCDFYDFSNIYRGWRDRPSFIGTNIINTRRLPAMTDDEVIASVIREMSEYLPEVKQAKLLHAVVHRIPMAIHCPHPGSEKLRLPVRTSIADLLLAGDWVRTNFPASMESAVYAGWRAAEEILRQVGRPTELAWFDPRIDRSALLTGHTWNYLPTMRIPRFWRKHFAIR